MRYSGASTGQPYSRDPRSTAKRAQSYLAQTGIGDTAVFGPELEFFVFDDVRFDVSQNQTFYALNEEEGDYNSGAVLEGNIGRRPGMKAGISPSRPSIHDRSTRRNADCY